MESLSKILGVTEIASDVCQIKEDYRKELADTQEAVDGKLDKPSVPPNAAGKVLRVTAVNEDGSFVCEWGDEVSVDAALTEAGKAADAKETGDRIDQLNENHRNLQNDVDGMFSELSRTRTLGVLTADDLKWGFVNGSTGEIAWQKNRLVTVNFLAENVARVECVNPYYIRISAWDRRSGAYIGNWDGSGWANTNANHSVFESFIPEYEYKICIVCPANAEDDAAIADAAASVTLVIDAASGTADDVVDALRRKTVSGRRLVIDDSIAGAPMRCACDSQITISGLNLSPVGEASFKIYKSVQFPTTLAAGTYVFSARCESTDTDSEKAMFRVGSRYMSMAHDNNRHSFKFTLNDAADEMYLYASDNAANSAGDTAFWRDIMIVAGSEDKPYEQPAETVVCDASSLMLTAQTNILVADTDITITYVRRNEWLNAILSSTKSAELNAQTLGYVTPEMFGAAGDGVTDDLAAMQASIDSAQQMNLPMRANRSYSVTDSIVINSNLDAQINSIISSTVSAAVQIKGSENRVSIRSIHANGVGLELLADGNRCLYNDVEVHEIKSGSDCIYLYNANNGAIASNSIRFRLLKAGGDGCSCINSECGEKPGYTTENSYYGGQCTNADWAARRVAGNSKLFNFQVETNIKGGFLFEGDAQALIVGARYAESQRDGEYPFLKIKTEDEISNSGASAVANLRFIGCNSLKVNEIDISEVTTVVYQASNPDNKWALASNGSLGYIDCRIVGYAETGSDNYTIPQHFAEGALIWGNCLILKGVPRRRYCVKQSIDLRTIGADTPALPTIFEIGCANCEIRLHPTYCFMGENRFRVIQTAEHTATIYDYYSGNVVFDGESLGEGEFEVETYLDKEYTIARIDGEGMAWRIRKIG